VGITYPLCFTRTRAYGQIGQDGDRGINRSTHCGSVRSFIGGRLRRADVSVMRPGRGRVIAANRTYGIKAYHRDDDINADDLPRVVALAPATTARERRLLTEQVDTLDPSLGDDNKFITSRSSWMHDTF